MDGVEYTIRDREGLRRLIREKRWAEVERTCTSLITDFSELFRNGEILMRRLVTGTRAR